MLDQIEKLVAGTIAFLLVVTLSVYAWLGSPSTTSAEFIPSVTRMPPPPSASSGAPEQAAVPTAEERAIVEKLRQQGRKVSASQKLPVEHYQVPEKLFEEISAEANLLPELKKYRSMPLTVNENPTRLQLSDVTKGTNLDKLGLKEDDVIELIDGQIVEFRNTNTTQYYNLFSTAVKKLRAGQPVTVTVTRNNQPVHIEYRLPAR
jgi:S1-C subfamily serine protease